MYVLLNLNNTHITWFLSFDFLCIFNASFKYTKAVPECFKARCSSPKRAYSLLSGPLFDWVIENLLKNALDAMTGAGIINIKLKAEAAEVIIDIADTGKGISKKNISRVFKPGFTTKKRGWGLGLSLSKRIIEQYHKGQLFVKSSELGKGTTFRIVLNK